MHGTSLRGDPDVLGFLIKACLIRQAISESLPDMEHLRNTDHPRVSVVETTTFEASSNFAKQI